MTHLVWEFSPCLKDCTIPQVSGKSLRRWPENCEGPKAIFHSDSPMISRPLWEDGKMDAGPSTGISAAPSLSQAEANYPCLPHLLACLLGLASVLIRKRLLPWCLKVNKAICDLINQDGQVCPFLPSPLYWAWTMKGVSLHVEGSASLR